MNSQSGRKNQRSVALRAIMSGLLASSLSDNELKRLAQDLDLEFLSNLREMLLLLPLPSRDYGEEIPPPIALDDSLAQMIVDRIKGRRLSKNQVYSYMREVDPSLAKSVIRPGDTIRESIEHFVNNSGAETGNQLLGRILGAVEQDPYLAGISKRK